MVYRVYVEKKKELANEARDLLSDAKEFLQIRNLINAMRQSIRIKKRLRTTNFKAFRVQVESSKARRLSSTMFAMQKT